MRPSSAAPAGSAFVLIDWTTERTAPAAYAAESSVAWAGRWSVVPPVAAWARRRPARASAWPAAVRPVSSIDGPHLVLEPRRHAPHLAHDVADLARRLRQLVRPEDDQGNEEDDEQLATADVEHAERLTPGRAPETDRERTPSSAARVPPASCAGRRARPADSSRRAHSSRSGHPPPPPAGSPISDHEAPTARNEQR